MKRRPLLRRLRGRSARRALALAALLLVLGVGWRGFRALAGEPSDELVERWHEGHEVLARDGTTLRQLPSAAGARGRSIALAEMGERLLIATIVSEDKRFFEHEGVDAVAIARAAGQNASRVRVVSGASTITQQLVKLLDHQGKPRPRSLSEKLWEAARAQNLEHTLDKRQILEAYLNRLGYGHGLVGPDAAARGYFGVAPAELSWAQAASLAVLPRAPSQLDLYRRPEQVERRQRALLEAMHEQGVLSADDLGRALAEPVVPKPLARGWRAPHFVEMLRAEARLHPGAETLTTLDPELQADTEGLVQAALSTLARRAARNAAAIVVDNASGEVLAYVGNGDFSARDTAGQVDHARARRQPGSTLKPFVYALAYSHGHAPVDLVADVPTAFGRGAGAYAPDNFDGQFRGPLSLREALAGSLNVPAVRLAAELPDSALLDLLHGLGVRSLDRSAAHYGLALALGSGEVTLRELAAAYAALARAGQSVELRYAVGDAAELGVAQAGEVCIDRAVAALISESLSDPLARVRGLGGRGPFDFGFPVAVKTGTSSGFRDGWTVGYSRERTVAVWVGNADGRPTAELSGAEGAGPLFVDVMRRAMRNVRPRAPLWDPELLVARAVCPLSGKPVGPACPEAVTRWFPRPAAGETELPTAACDLHRPATHRGSWRCDAAGTEAVVLLPDEYADWLAAQPEGAPGRDPSGQPWLLRSAVPGCSTERAAFASLAIDEPADGSVVLLSRAGPDRSQRLPVRVSLAGSPRAGATAIELLLDGRLALRTRIGEPTAIEVGRGDHELTARPADANAPLGVATSRFSVR